MAFLPTSTNAVDTLKVCSFNLWANALAFEFYHCVTDARHVIVGARLLIVGVIVGARRTCGKHFLPRQGESVSKLSRSDEHKPQFVTLCSNMFVILLFSCTSVLLLSKCVVLEETTLSA